MENTTPRKAGYSMPAEWAPHDATWLAWPHNPLSFPERVIGEVEQTYCSIISSLSECERVKLLVNDADEQARVEKLLASHSYLEKNLIFHQIKSADVWIRDYGPTFLLDGKGGKALVKWNYNAYGGKYDDLLYDDKTGEDIANAAHVRIFRPGIILEGGSIEADGNGALLTTEQCLLNPNRNPHLSKEQIEGFLREYTGASKTIWLKSGIEGDDTDGHVDDFARFAPDGVVLCASGGGDRDGRVLDKNLELLKGATDAEGNALETLKLPMPRPLVDAEENRQLPASYANFYISNKAVLLPVFGDAKDREAAEILGSAFPGREVVQINARGLVFGYGGIHCASQQEPSARRS